MSRNVPPLELLARLADPEVVPDPYPVLARLREASPFAAADGALVVVGRHRDCSAILRDPRASSERNRSLLASPGEARARSFLSMDPPDHARLRGLVSRAFTVARGGMQAAGLPVPDGAALILLLAATGRDPDAYAEPDRFDIRRGVSHGAPGHLAFAAGQHFCLGAPLARLEATIAVQELAARLTAPEPDLAGLAYKPNLNLRGPRRFVVRFSGITRC
jgi:cytochrome P450